MTVFPVASLLAIVMMLLGVVLLFVGVRGRHVGEDPHCRNCGFNLRGLQDSTARCPECGGELTPSNLQIGSRQRRRGFIGTGVFLLLLTGTWFGIGGWRFISNYDWTPWKPVSWLLADVDSSTGSVRQSAFRELRRRAADPSISQSSINAIVDPLLARQADLNKKWDTQFGQIIEAAAKQNRVDQPRLQRYVKQGLTASLEIKPKLRRGQPLSVSVDLSFHRYGDFVQLNGQWHTTSLKFDDEVIREKWVDPGDSDHQLAGTIGYTTGLDTAFWKKLKLPDGKHVAQSKVVVRARVDEPFKTDPVDIEVPITAPVEIVPADGMVDIFKTDELLRDQMRDGFLAARVLHNASGDIEVRVKVDRLPMPVSAEVVLKQGEREEVCGVMHIESDRKQRWQSAYNRRKSKLTGVVDIILRPKQDPADGTRTINTYWGEPVTLSGILIDAPYTPPFKIDESLRPAVQKSIGRPTLKRTDQQRGIVSVTIDLKPPPTKLAFQVFLLIDGKELKVENGDVSVDLNSGYGFGRNTSIPTAATKANVILRPDAAWEIHTFDSTPPWGGEVVFRDVPIE